MHDDSLPSMNACILPPAQRAWCSRASWLDAGVHPGSAAMIRKLTNGQYRLYSRKPDPKTGKRRNLGTFSSRAAAEKHEREVQYFKRH
jgi:hypothetical protein